MSRPHKGPLAAGLHDDEGCLEDHPGRLPPAPTADYLAGYGDGWEAGQVAGLALALSVIIGESPNQLIENAHTGAAVDSTFPLRPVRRADLSRGRVMALDDEVVPCPTCWLLADLLPPRRATACTGRAACAATRTHWLRWSSITSSPCSAPLSASPPDRRHRAQAPGTGVWR